MGEAPLSFKSLTPYYIVLFVGLLVWAFTGLTVAEFSLFTLHESAIDWIVNSVLVLATLSIYSLILSWRMKHQISYNETTWNYREQEIGLSEYIEMIREYRKKYSHLTSQIDFLFLGLSLLSLFSAIILPAILAQSLTTFIYGPLLFGGSVIVYGLLVSNFFFKLIPNEASMNFKLPEKGQLRKHVLMLRTIPGISWVGVTVQIGETDGFYVIRDSKPVARIEGIESAARLVITTTEGVTPLVKVEPKSELEMNINPIEIDEDGIRGLVIEVLETYISLKGSDEILEEILEELGITRTSLSTDDELILEEE
ncbi:MAG: hypothetical protein RTU30_06825 [Candidatus Thorarchaeota archaeon]